MRNLPKRVFTQSQIRTIEQQHAQEHNGHCYDLMQRAGLCVFNLLIKRNPNPREVWVFCGRGNNGGDGYVVANYLQEHNIKHRVFAIDAPHEDSEAYLAFSDYCNHQGLVEIDLPEAPESMPDVIVDAILGTGLTAAVRSRSAEFINFINKCNCDTISVDIPSGVMADSGCVLGECVQADATLCVLGLKPGLLTSDAVDYVGELYFDNLGIDTDAILLPPQGLDSNPPLPVVLRSYEDVIDDLPRRSHSSNKGDNGKVLIVGGAQGYAGAALIAGLGALRSGAGLVKVALDRFNFSALNAFCPELMSVDFSDKHALATAIDWADVIAIGPGLSQQDAALQILGQVLSSNRKTVLDADALNLIALHGLEIHGDCVMTPHPGEAARLLGSDIDSINTQRLKSAYELQQHYGAIVLLKGAGSIICSGKRLTILDEGSETLATGGTGDLLTGMIASFIAQGMTLSQATVNAALVHGRAGYLCGLEQGVVGSLPTDLIVYVRRLINATN